VAIPEFEPRRKISARNIQIAHYAWKLAYGRIDQYVDMTKDQLCEAASGFIFYSYAVTIAEEQFLKDMNDELGGYPFNSGFISQQKIKLSALHKESEKGDFTGIKQYILGGVENIRFTPDGMKLTAFTNMLPDDGIPSRKLQWPWEDEVILKSREIAVRLGVEPRLEP
jgi:hypothetical protein